MTIGNAPRRSPAASIPVAIDSWHSSCGSISGVRAGAVAQGIRVEAPSRGK